MLALNAQLSFVVESEPIDLPLLSQHQSVMRPTRNLRGKLIFKVLELLGHLLNAPWCDPKLAIFVVTACVNKSSSIEERSVSVTSWYLDDLDHFVRAVRIFLENYLLWPELIVVCLDGSESSISAFTPAICFSSFCGDDSMASAACNVNYFKTLKLFHKNWWCLTCYFSVSYS